MKKPATAMKRRMRSEYTEKAAVKEMAKFFFRLQAVTHTSEDYCPGTNNPDGMITVKMLVKGSYGAFPVEAARVLGGYTLPAKD